MTKAHSVKASGGEDAVATLGIAKLPRGGGQTSVLLFRKNYAVLERGWSRTGGFLSMSSGCPVLGPPANHANRLVRKILEFAAWRPRPGPQR